MEMNSIALAKQVVERIAINGGLNEENAKAINDALALADKYFTAYFYHPEKYSWQTVRENAEKFPTHSEIQSAMFQAFKKTPEKDDLEVMNEVLYSYYPDAY